MTAFNTDRPVGVPMTPTFWKPNAEINVDGDWQYEGMTPGFWTTTWRSQVGGSIDNGWFGDTLGYITAPVQTYQANTAPNRIYNGIMQDYPEDLKTLQEIEADPKKTGKDWYDALPKDIRGQFESMGITPVNTDYDAGTFANDMRQTLAWATYGRDTERGYTKYNDAGLFVANIGLSVVTDPTTLLSFGAGSAVKGAKSASILSKMGIKSTLAMNAGLAAGQSAESLIQRDYVSERLGIIPGDMSASDIGTETIKTAAIATATGGALYAAGYYAGMGLSKFNRKVSTKAQEIAAGLVDNPNVLSHTQAENLLSRMISGVNLEPKEQAGILAETMNAVYGTKFDASVWDWDAMDAVGVRPLEMAFKVAMEGYSGKQVQDMLNNAYRVLEDANASHVAPVGPQLLGDNLTESIKSTASTYVPEGPVLPIRKLPDFMEQAGYSWDSLGNLVKDPNKVPTVVNEVAPVVEQPTPPVKQPLLPEVVDTIKSVSKRSDNPIESALLESTSYEDFVNKLADVVKTTKLSKEQINLVKKLGNDEIRYSQNKELLSRNTPDTDAKLSPDTLIQEVRKLTGRQDTLVTRDPKENTKSSPLLEIPNTVDRLVWMTGRSWGQTVKDASGNVNLEKSLTYKGTAEKILGDYFGMGVRDIMVHRAKMEQALRGLKLGRAPIDRIQVVRNPNGSYSATILRVAQDSKVGPKGAKASGTPRKSPEAKAEAYAAKRNAAVQRALERKRAAFLNKTLKQSEVPAVSLTVPGLDRESTSAYNQMVKYGHLADAYNLLNNQLVGEGNFQKIRALTENTKAAKYLLDVAIRTKDETKINDAKAELDKVNRQLEKYKQRLFAVSDRNFGKFKLIEPLDASKGALSRNLLGTPFEPAHQFYVEPVGNEDSPTSHQALLQLDRAFVSMDPANVAARIDTDIPTGFFAKATEALTGLNSHLFLQSDAGRLLLNKTPLLGHFVNAVAPSTLMNAGELGSTKISPSNETMHLRNQAEGNAVVFKTIDALRSMGIGVDTPEMKRAIYDAMAERTSGTIKASTKFREATDYIKANYFSYYDKVNAEGVAVGKIRQADNTYCRVTTNQKALHDVEGVSMAFYDAAVSFFTKDDSVIHMETLKTLRSLSVPSETPIKTLADLRKADAALADEYVKALRNTDKRSPLRSMTDKQIRVRQGLDVTDDVEILREASYYMNSGLGKHLDSELLLDPRMYDYIQTDLAHMMEEYNRNVRYYISRQEVTDRLIANITGEQIKGVTWRDMLSYFRGKLLEQYPTQSADIDNFFKSLEAKEGQITGRGRAYRDHELLLDSAAIVAVAPLQTAVAAGSTFTSSLAESAKQFGSALMTSMHGTGGNRTFFGTMGNIIKRMSKADMLASTAAMMQVHTHGMLREIDGSINNYAGGYYLPTKLNNMRRAFKNISDAIGTPTNTKAAKINNLAKALGGAIVEPVRQIAHIDNINAVNARGYHSQGMYKMAGVLEQFIKDPDFLKKVRRDEIVNRLEEAGLFSPEAKKGLQAFLDKRKDLISGYFEMRDMNDVLLEIHADPKVPNGTSAAAQAFYNAFWGAADRFMDSRIMTLPRLWDQANPSSSPYLNRLLNTFSGYSRWFFSRNMQQNFPNSRMHKVGALLAWYTVAEAVSMLLRDAMLDYDKFVQMVDSEDDELFETYMTKAVLRVPLFGQLTNGTYDAVAIAHDVFSTKENKWNTTSYRAPSMFSGSVYISAFQEIGKAARGEDYDPEKIRKATPYLSAPIFGGWLKAAQQE